ncbi:MAG: trypsin-like peptidase domain-containing protein, partial [Pseudobdellovibrio sp.]
GHIYKIKNVLKYSNYRDVVEFDLQSPPTNIEPLKIENHSEVADPIFVVGNALGEGISFRAGQISSFTPEEIQGLWKFIRFSAAASPGNSGGPLLNGDGAVVGIVVRKSPSENLNYAVPFSELEKLPGDKAEFDFHNLKFVREHVTEERNLSLSMSLPTSLAAMAAKGPQFFANVYGTEYLKFWNDKDTRFFPLNPNFQTYIRGQSHIGRVGFVESAQNGNEWAVNEATQTSTNIGLDQEVKIYRRGSWEILSLPIPKAKTQKDFIADSDLLMQTVLKSIVFYRRFAGDNIRIESLGAAQKTERWSDNLGRPWISYVWDSKTLDHSITLDCTAIVGSVLCSYGYQTFQVDGLISYFRKDLLRIMSNKILFPYSGSVKQWQDFLQLDASLKPTLFKNLEITLQKNKSLWVREKNRQFTFIDSEMTDESNLRIRPSYAMNPDLTLDIMDVIVTPNESTKSGYQISTLLKPAANSPKKVKDVWSNALNHKSNFSGVSKTNKDYDEIYMSADPGGADADRLSYVKCWNETGSDKTKLTAHCESFKNINKL